MLFCLGFFQMISEESEEADGLVPGQYEETDEELLMHMSNLNLEEDLEKKEMINVLTMANPVFKENTKSSKVLHQQSAFNSILFYNCFEMGLIIFETFILGQVLKFHMIVCVTAEVST